MSAESAEPAVSAEFRARIPALPLPAPQRRVPVPASAREAETATARTRVRRRRPPWVLMYHSVSACTDDPYRITVAPHRLDRQLRWLRDRGLSGVSVGELMRARAAGRGAGLVGLTFDDGYADFVDSALPLLRRHGCTATVFVLPGRLGGDNAWDELGPRKPLLTAEGIRVAADGGMEIGSHGLMHTDLTTADDATLEQETKHSRTLLADITGTAPQGFCYPYGTVDSRAVEAVRRAGYGYACAIDPGALTGTHALPRVHIDASDTSVRLFLKRMLHPLRRKPLPSEPAAQESPAQQEPAQQEPARETPARETPAGQTPDAPDAPDAPESTEPARARTRDGRADSGRGAAGRGGNAVGSEAGGGR